MKSVSGLASDLEENEFYLGLSQRARTCLLDTARRQPVAFVGGEGAWLCDNEGRRYLDMVSAVGVTVLGHNAPVITETILQQAQQMLHAGNHWYTESQIEAAEELVRCSFPGRVFFCNSGAEANEAAIKLVRKWAFVEGRIGRTILCAAGSFHGRTLGALAASGQERYWSAFHPLPGGFAHIPLDEFPTLERHITRDVIGVMIEPIQGEVGVISLADETLKHIRSVCDDFAIPMIVDEVQTGMGRTGRFWAHEYSQIKPDILTTAKGLGGGVPIGALISGRRTDVFEPGDHASTFGGNSLATAVASAVLRTIREHKLFENAQRTGALLSSLLTELKREGYPIETIRGRGLMIGIVLSADLASEVARAALAERLLLNSIGTRVIRLLPPLILSEEEAAVAVDSLRRAFNTVA